ncbi:acyltransferase family protein [Candidatus Korobacter versatilis]|nr:acyltransferase [Candidatus Koribacter versatilis]
MRVKEGLQHIPELDGLRGIAILAVMGFHFSGDTPVYFGKLAAVYWAFFYGGNGVDLFFVLSGFLITSILLHTKESPQYFSSFYARRVLRIFPLYFLAVALFFYVELPWLEHLYGARSTLRSEQIWYWTYLVNWHDTLGNIVGAMGHFWSLAIEEQFYFVWPLAIWLCSRKRVPLLCIGAIVLSTALRLVCDLRGYEVEYIHRATFTRFDTLALGGLLAWIATDEHWMTVAQRCFKFVAPASLVLFAANEFAHAELGRFAGYVTVSYSLMALMCGSLIFYGIAHTGDGTLLAKITRSAFLRNAGKYSYSMYIFHLVAKREAMVPIVNALRGYGLPLSIAIIFGMVVCGLLTYAFALLTWNAFEKHFLKLKDRFPYDLPADTRIATVTTA